MGDEIEQRRFRPLAIELGEGGEHAASELRPWKRRARGRRNVLDRRLLGTLGARLPGFQIGRAGDDDRIDIQARALRCCGDGLKRRPCVGVVGNDDLKDDLRGGGFADLPDPFELGDSHARPHIGMTDEEARLQHAQGVNGSGRRFDLVVG